MTVKIGNIEVGDEYEGDNEDTPIPNNNNGYNNLDGGDNNGDKKKGGD